MRKRVSVNHLNRIIKRFGSLCFAQVKGQKPKLFHAFVEDANRSRRGMTGSKALDELVLRLGHDRHKRLIMYAIYDDFWSTDDEIRILYRGKMYTVEYDSTMYIGDTPVYVWAMLLPVGRARDNYADIDDPDDCDDVEVIS